MGLMGMLPLVRAVAPQRRWWLPATSPTVPRWPPCSHWVPRGALGGTRFLATAGSPLPNTYKQAIVASDGHDTLATEIPDLATGTVWPGAYRNQFVQRWIGREGDLRA